VARVFAVLKKAIIAMQHSDTPTLHRYLPTRATVVEELEVMCAAAMTRKSALDTYRLTPLQPDDENLAFAKKNMIAVTAEVALLTDAIAAAGLGPASRLSVHPLHAAATMLHPEFWRFAYVVVKLGGSIQLRTVPRDGPCRSSCPQSCGPSRWQRA
jgi:hypothetical protein